MPKGKKASNEETGTFSFRAPAELIAQFEERAKSAGISKSEMARKLLFTGDRVIVMEGGTEIASRLYQLNSKLETYRNCDKISVQDLDEIRKELARNAACLCDIAQHLTDLTEEEDDYEHSDDD